MKNGRFTLPEKLQGKQGRTLLAVGIGLLAMVLILLAIFFMLLGFAAEAREKRRRKVHQQPRNTVKSGRKAG